MLRLEMLAIYLPCAAASLRYSYGIIWSVWTGKVHAMVSLAPIVVAVALLSVGGCSHTVHVIGRAGAPSGTTTVATGGQGGSGDMTLPLDGKVYNGRWVYVPSGGGIGLTTATAYNGWHSATATGTTVMPPMGGNGSLLLSAGAGDTLRCMFNYSSWHSTGIGECQDDAGRSYDLQITR